MLKFQSPNPRLIEVQESVSERKYELWIWWWSPEVSKSTTGCAAINQILKNYWIKFYR